MDALLRERISEKGPSISDALADLVGKIRESITFKKAAKVTAFPGVVGSYVHGSIPGFPSLGTAAAVVSIGTGSGSDRSMQDKDVFVNSRCDLAGTVVPTSELIESLRPLARRLAMHIVAAQPPYLDEHSIPPEVLEKEKALLRGQASESGKPASIVDKMIEGRLKKFYADLTLLHQVQVAPCLAGRGLL